MFTAFAFTPVAAELKGVIFGRLDSAAGLSLYFALTFKVRY